MYPPLIPLIFASPKNLGPQTSSLFQFIRPPATGLVRAPKLSDPLGPHRVLGGRQGSQPLFIFLIMGPDFHGADCSFDASLPDLESVEGRNTAPPRKLRVELPWGPLLSLLLSPHTPRFNVGSRAGSRRCAGGAVYIPSGGGVLEANPRRLFAATARLNLEEGGTGETHPTRQQTPSTGALYYQVVQYFFLPPSWGTGVIL